MRGCSSQDKGCHPNIHGISELFIGRASTKTLMLLHNFSPWTEIVETLQDASFGWTEPAPGIT
jgi:hypothetical protein